jgi:hypothetical protein
VKRGVIRKSKNEPPLIPVVFAALCGCEEGIENIESAKKDFPYKIFTEICDVIKTEDKCFDGNRVFSSDDERSKARQVALRNGKQLVKGSPLGHADGQLLVIFKDRTPNNTLPILWANSEGGFKWTPLFKRY